MFRLLRKSRLCIHLVVIAISSLTSKNTLAQDSPAGGETAQTEAAESAGAHGYEMVFAALGTKVTLKAFHADKALVKQAFLQAEQHVRELEAILTDYDSQSETRQLSLRAFEQPVRVSEDLWRVLHASDQWYQRTGGTFDSSLGVLTRLWRKYRRVRKLPSEAEIEQALSKTGWEHVRLDPAERTVAWDLEGLQLDFGAIGKGYIVDAAFERLLEHGVDCCLVDISGNIRCGVPPPGRKGWRIEVSPLQKGEPPLRRVELSQAALATSGDLWQYVVVDGQRRSHILDPETGMGVAGPRAATVWSAKAVDADALATAACIMDPNDVLRLAKDLKLEVLMARRLPSERIETTVTPGFPVDGQSPCTPGP